MRRLILITIQLFSLCLLHAQTIKTQVLVIGSGATGTGAAIQAAHSGVKTVLLNDGNQFGRDLGVIDTTLKIGVQADFIRLYKSVQPLSRAKITAAEAGPVIKSWTDTIKNLQVVLNATPQKIQKAGKGWKLDLSNGSTVKADVIVDATANGIVASKMGSQAKSRLPYDVLNPEEFYNNNIYRTAVATGGINNTTAVSAPLAAFVTTNIENLVIVPNGQDNGIPSTLAGGQAAGAVAAYCAFFKTTTEKLNIRVVQGELLAYKSWLIPFADIAVADSNFAEIQHIAATGIMKAKSQNGKLYFQPDSSVSLKELRQPVKEYYSRSQIWKADKTDGDLTLEDAIDLIKFVGLRGQELNREVEKGWKTSFKFKSTFDLKKLITRREFAVLVDNYLKPFNVRVDASGKLVF